MQKSITITIIAIVIVLILGIGVYFYVVNSSTTNYPNTPSTNNNPSSNNNPPVTNPDTANTTPPTLPTQTRTYTIDIMNFAFSLSSLTINKGDTVIWTNQDSASHTVTSDSGSELDSSSLSKSQTYSHTFNNAGTFSYHCTPHPYMKATITVQ